MDVFGGTKEYGTWRATMQLTRGRGPFSTVMARVELPSDIKYQGNAFLDIKISPFLDRKEQLHLPFRSYLPMHRFYCRFKRSSNNNHFYHWGARPLLSTPPATYIIHFMKMDVFRDGIMNIFKIITRNYMHKYTVNPRIGPPSNKPPP